MKIRTKSSLLSICTLILLTAAPRWCLLAPKPATKEDSVKIVTDKQDNCNEGDSRKLVNEASPVVETNQLTNPNSGSDLNKIDGKNTDQYDQMDQIVNDIKQVIGF
jgi:hypothetical protein